MNKGEGDNMISVGIDALAIDTSRYALALATLANARQIDPDKYHEGLGQFIMSVPPPGEDIVTLAANATKKALRDIDVNDIDLLLFATESGIDQSKAAGIYVHGLLKLPSRCRVVELKQACYAGTAGLQLALPYLRENPHKKVLLIASDIARYGLNTTGESSQGAAAIAMVLSAHPRILAFEREFGVVTENVMDFWRPNYSHEALVDGKYSSKLYLQMLEKSFEQYEALSGRDILSHDYFCYHTPVPRLVEKAHQHLLKLRGQDHLSKEVTQAHIANGLQYGRQIGNSYTAALYINLASLLDLTTHDLSHKRIGFYSYGSGCVAEYFSGIVQPTYRSALKHNDHAAMIAHRKMLTYDDYAAFYSFNYVEDGSTQMVPTHDTGHFRLAKMENHKRIYEVVDAVDLAMTLNEEKKSAHSFVAHADINKTTIATRSMKVFVPGKLILSGEHAVVYGQPALAMAINRFVSATVMPQSSDDVSFDLADLSHQSALSYNALRHLKSRIKEKYHRFIRGEYSIRDVLQKPFELAQFALGMMVDAFNLSVPPGVKIKVQSDLPLGCGMGSSAATILSVMQAIANYLQLPIPEEKLFKLALEAENMQHGHSSGLDLHIAMQGGCLYMQGDRIEKRTIPSIPLYLVNTGAPQSSTGQCVEKVAPFFKSQSLRDDFANVTQAMDQAIFLQSLQAMQAAIKENHQLLTHIGVVPKRVQQFIAEIEAQSGAAKICGAGAISGDAAGALMVATEDASAIIALSKQFDYNIIPISGVTRGMHAA